MKLFVIVAALLAAPAAFAQRPTQMVVVTAQDYSAVEFQQQQTNPIQDFDLSMPGQHITRLPNMNQWIGHSWAPGWNQTQYQTFRLNNLIPGGTYTINLKFYYKSRAALDLVAFQGGRTISSYRLDDSNMSYYWPVTFVAQSFYEVIQLGHYYAGDHSSVAYAYFDYMQITANDWFDVGPIRTGPRPRPRR